MSTTVFPFTVIRPYFEDTATETIGVDLNGGLIVRRANFGTSPGWIYVAEFSVRLPRGGYDIDDWMSFVNDRTGGVDTFLFKAHADYLHDVTDEAVGTGDGSETVFALDKKYLDASTLVVKVDGVTQTGGGTDYTFSGNNTAPILTFTSPVTNLLPVTASYDYYMPVWFAEDPPRPRMTKGGPNSANSGYIVSGIRIAEQFPGAHLV